RSRLPRGRPAGQRPVHVLPRRGARRADRRQGVRARRRRLRQAQLRLSPRHPRRGARPHAPRPRAPVTPRRRGAVRDVPAAFLICPSSSSHPLLVAWSSAGGARPRALRVSESQRRGEEEMNKAMVLLAGALATLSLVGPTFAQSTAPAAKEPSAPAEKPGAQRDQTTQQMTASVVSVNPDAKTLTVKRGYKGKQLTFAVESGAATHLGDLK